MSTENMNKLINTVKQLVAKVDYLEKKIASLENKDYSPKIGVVQNDVFGTTQIGIAGSNFQQTMKSAGDNAAIVVETKGGPVSFAGGGGALSASDLQQLQNSISQWYFKTCDSEV
jgi:hypothetical protein